MLDIDGYSDLERIGHGGLGDVYRATRTSTGGTVAIKILRDVSDESVAWNRTRRELTALVSLGGHAHVIQLIELLEHLPGLVMEYAPGGSVAQLLERRGTTLTIGEVILIGRQTASALAAAHAQGIIHRDVKPQNLLVDAYGQVKLCDFGIASLTRTEEFRARTNAVSMRYASPEDLDDEADVGPPADVYSLGATLLHLAHGAPPTLKERLTPWTPPPRGDREQATLDEILASCLHPTPAVRPTAAQVLERLEHVDWSCTDRRRALDGGAPLVTHSLPEPPIPTNEVPQAVPTTQPDPPVTEETLLRTGRRRPEPPRPPAPSKRRVPPSLLAVGGIAIAAALGGWLLTTGDRDDPGASPTITAPTTTMVAAPTVTTTPTTTTPVGTDAAFDQVIRPDGLVALDDPSITWPIGPVGECLVQLADSDTLQVVDCDEPHDLERFAAGVLPTDSDDDPYDAATVNAAVDDACAAAFADEVDAVAADLQIAQTRPSAASWAEGDRAYQCLLGIPDTRLVGAAGAG